MSGHKRATVTLSEADLRKLAGVEERLRRVEGDYQTIREKARQEQDGVLWQGLQQMEGRQRAMQQALVGVDAGLAEVEAQAAQALLEQAGQAQQELSAQLSGQVSAELAGLSEALWQETSALLEAQRQELEALAAESQAARQEQLQRLEGELEEHTQQQADWEGRQAQAEQALQAAEALLGVVAADEQFARYYPGEAAGCQQVLELAQHNLEGGMAEAALVAAQQAYLQLSRQRMALERRLWQRRCLLGAALGRACQALEKGVQWAQVAAIDLEGQELPMQIDVAYWSGGKYTRALERCRRLVALLEAGAEGMDAAELTELHNVQLAAIEGELEEAVYQARREVLASQVRYNLAECVVQALGEQGFALQEGGYQQSDPRRGYQVAVRHYDGSEVVVQVEPLAEQVGMSQLDLHSLDREQRSEHELRQRAGEIARALLGYGLKVGRAEAAALPPKAAPNPAVEYLPPDPPAGRSMVREMGQVYGRIQ